MRKVLFEDHWFVVCENETELKKELLKKHGVKHTNQEYHHIFGKIGILALMPDNIIPVTANFHRMQKASDVKQRKIFDDMVKIHVNKNSWERLKALANHIRNKNVLFGKI